MSDFKTLEQVAKEMEEQRQKPWRPPQNAAEVNAETSRQRRLARQPPHRLLKIQPQQRRSSFKNDWQISGHFFGGKGISMDTLLL
jgi:hypothetical protein